MSDEDKNEMVIRDRGEVAIPSDPDDCGAFYRWEPVIMGDNSRMGMWGEHVQGTFAASGQLVRCIDEIVPLLTEADDEDRLRFITRMLMGCFRAGAAERDEYIRQMDRMIERLRPFKGTLAFTLDALFENSEGWLHPPRAVKHAIEDGQRRFKNLAWELGRMREKHLSAASTGPRGSP
jgi:hypothetical protein